MINKLRLLFIAFLTLVCGNIVAQTTKTWTPSSGVNLSAAIAVDNNITLTWSESSGDQAPKFSSNYIYFYNGNQVKLTAANECKILKIDFSFADDKQSMQILSGGGAYALSTWSGEASEVSFRAPKQTGARKISSIQVTYKTKDEVVELKANLNITESGINATADLDKAPSVYVKYKNEGNAATQNAKATLYVDGVENASADISELAVGAQSFVTISYSVANITAGDHQVYVKLTADNADAVQTEAKTVTFTKKAAEPTFELTAAPVTVQLPADKLTAVVNVKNTSTVDATDVKISLWYNGSIGSQTIESLVAGANQDVTFEIDNPFATAGDYTIQALTGDNKYSCNISVTVAAAPVEEVIDMEITAITGISEIDLTQENKIQVWYKNNSNVDVTNAVVTVKLNDSSIAEKTVSVAKEKNGSFDVVLPTGNLTAGVDATVVATVAVDKDTKAENNSVSKTYPVKGAAAAEAEFSLTADDVTVPYDATSYKIVVKVKNTSTVDATNVVVNLVESSIIDSKTIEALAAGAEQEVTFTIEGGPFTANKEYQVWIGNGAKANTSVKVTVSEAPVTPVIDIALVQFSALSEINLSAENTIQVWFSNNSNVDVENATITLKMNGNEIGKQTIAKNENYKLFELPTEGLEAGQEVTLVATLAVENNKEGNLTELTKTLSVVSGETEPEAEIALNPISSWDVEAGEQEVSVTVAVFNNGKVDAENVKVDLYHNYPTVLDTKTLALLKAGESAFVTFKFTYTFEQGNAYSFTAQTMFKDADANNNTQEFTISCKAPVADLTIEKIADIEATSDETVKVNVTVKNLSAVDAKEVKVALFNGTELVGFQHVIDEIEASGNKTIELTIGQLEAGTYNYNVQITSKDDNAENNMQTFAVKVTEPVEQKMEVALTQIQGSTIDLSAESNAITVWLTNNGTIDADVVVNAKLKETALEAQTIHLKAGKNGFVEFTLPTTGLVAGEQAALTVTIAVEENTSDAVSLAKVLDVIDSSVATEPVFELSAQDVEVELGAEKFDVVATLKNTSSVKAENVEVKLFHNAVVATETVAALAGGAETTVTFANVENPFAKAGVHNMQVLAGKAVATVVVNVKEPEEEPVMDLAIENIIGSIDLAATQSVVSVGVKNNGNVQVKNAAVKLVAGEKTLGTANVSVKAGETDYALINVASEGLTAGELEVTASVEAEGEATPADNTKTATIQVKAVPADEPTFALTVADIEVTEGEAIKAVVNVMNTSEVNATDVQVNIYFGMNVVATQTIASIEAGKNAEATLSLEELSLPAGNYELQAVAGKNNKFFNLTIKSVAPAEVVDLAVSTISGSLSMDIETNYVTVFVENKGNVKVTDATVKLMAGDVLLGTNTVTIAAGNTGFCSIAVPAEKLQVGEFTVVAKVEAENDADLTNNELTKTYTIAAPKPVLSFSAEAFVLRGTNRYEVKVTVTNESTNVDAENVIVKVFTENGQLLNSNTIKKIAANASETVVVAGTTEVAMDEGTKLQVFVEGVETPQWTTVSLADHTTTAIETLKAQMGENTKIFTLGGKQVNQVQKGSVYIINGKKVMVK